MIICFLGKVVISADVDMADNIGKSGEKHWTIKSWKHSYDLKEKSTIELENLFNGNEVLGKFLDSIITKTRLLKIIYRLTKIKSLIFVPVT